MPFSLCQSAIFCFFFFFLFGTSSASCLVCAEAIPGQLRTSQAPSWIVYKAPEQLHPEKFGPGSDKLCIADHQAADAWAAGLVAVTIVKSREPLEYAKYKSTLLAEQFKLVGTAMVISFGIILSCFWVRF